MNGSTPGEGWTPARIRDAIKARGVRITDLSRQHGLAPLALSHSLTSAKRFPRANQIVAGFLGMTLHELWPHWYPPEGYRNAVEARTYRAATYEVILARVAAGEALINICADPAMPSRPTLDNYRKRHPDYDARLRGAFGRREGVRVWAAEVERVVARVAAGEAVEAVCAEPDMPSYPAVSAHLARSPDLAARYLEAQGSRHGGRITPAKLDRVVAQLRQGAFLTSQTVMSYPSIRKYQRENPEFARRISGLYVSTRRLTPAERAARTAARRDRLRPFAHREAFLRALRHDEVYAIAESAVPRNLPPDMRDDVTSDLVVGLLSGEVRPDQAREAVRALTRSWRRMFAQRGPSLDDELRSGRKFGEMIADPSGFNLEGITHRVVVPGW